MSNDPASPRNPKRNEGTNGPDGPPGAPPPSLSAKYLGDMPKETTQDRANAAAKHAVTAIVAGIGLIALGIWLTSGSRQTIYYGAVLAGIASIIEGLYCGVSGTKYGDIPKAVHVVSFICGFVGAIVFACASSSR